MADQIAFGQLLKHARQSCGLTQLELAQRAHVSERTITYLERNQTSPRRDTVFLIADALNLQGEIRANFEAAASRSRGRLPGGVIPGEYSLPPSQTSFVGRKQDLEHLEALLSGPPPCRLVVLTGPGGCGKTRLAMETAHRVGAAYPDGVWQIALEAVDDATFLPQVIARELGLPIESTSDLGTVILQSLRWRHGLILLDNCEHLRPWIATTATTILQQCPQITILATSRAPFGISEEHVYRLAPLTLPREESAGDLEAIRRATAVELFEQRAKVAWPAFDLTASNATAVATLCRHLDGLPLAIELVVPWLETLPVEEIAAQIPGYLDLLVSESRSTRRHQTMREAIAWSYRSLSSDERWMLRRLAVFAAGASKAAIVAVCAGEGRSELAVVTALNGLVSRSLVLADEVVPGVRRYRLLELIREYGAEQAIVENEWESARRRHCKWCIALAERLAYPLEGGAEIDQWLEGIEQEVHNVRAALTWAQDREPALGLRLLAALWPFWYLRHGQAEGRRWYAEFDSVPCADRRTSARVKFGQAMMAVWHDPGAARPLLNEALTIADELRDEYLCASLRWPLAHTLLVLGDLAGMRAQLDASARYVEACGTPGLRSAYLAMFGYLAFNEGDWDEARDRLAAAQRQARLARLPHLLCMILTRLGDISMKRGDFALARKQFMDLANAAEAAHSSFYRFVALLRDGNAAEWNGDLDRAEAIYHDCLALARHDGNGLEEAHSHLGLGRVALYQGDGEQALDRFLLTEQYTQQSGERRVWAELAVPLISALWEWGRGDQAGEVCDRLATIIDRWNDRGESFWLATSLEEIAILVADSGQPELAARWLGTSRRLHDEHGSRVPPVRARRIARLRKELAAILGNDGLAAACREGHRQSLALVAEQGRMWVRGLRRPHARLLA